MGAHRPLTRRRLFELTLVAMFCTGVSLWILVVIAWHVGGCRPGPKHETRFLLAGLYEGLAEETREAEDLARQATFQEEWLRQSRGGDAYNVASELLHRFLAKRGKLAGLRYFGEGNTDEDTWGPGAEAAEAREVVDAWGNPIVVVFRAWLPVIVERGLAYVDGCGYDGEATAPALGAARFVLFSPGEDGVPNTADDLTVWGW